MVGGQENLYFNDHISDVQFVYDFEYKLDGNNIKLLTLHSILKLYKISNPNRKENLIYFNIIFYFSVL